MEKYAIIAPEIAITMINATSYLWLMDIAVISTVRKARRENVTIPGLVIRFQEARIIVLNNEPSPAEENRMPRPLGPTSNIYAA